MALSFIGYHGAQATSVATVNAVGDLLLVRAFRSASSTAPSLATDFDDGGTTATGGGGTHCASRLGWRVATATNQGSGTWANATAVEVLVFRGQKTTDPVVNVASSTQNGTAAFIRYPALTLTGGETGQWIAAFGGRVTTGAIAGVATAPDDGTTALVNRGSTPATPYVSAHAALAAGNWTQTDITPGGTNVKYCGWTVEVLAEPDPTTTTTSSTTTTTTAPPSTRRIFIS